jgi:serine/threonine protein kinase
LLNELISSRLAKLQQIIHPNLIHYEAVESKATEIKILMDVSPLGNLSKKISSEGRLPEGTVSFYTKQILEGLL